MAGAQQEGEKQECEDQQDAHAPQAYSNSDVLRRAEIPVIVASDAAGPVEGSHGISVVATTALAKKPSIAATITP